MRIDSRSDASFQSSKGKHRAPPDASLNALSRHSNPGRNHGVNGDGVAIPSAAIANSFDRVQALVDWVEKSVALPKTAPVTSTTKALPLRSYPSCPRYLGGALPTNVATSYTMCHRLTWR